MPGCFFAQASILFFCFTAVTVSLHNVYGVFGNLPNHMQSSIRELKLVTLAFEENASFLSKLAVLP